MSADPRCEICGVPLAVGVDDPPDERPRFGVDPKVPERCISHGPANLGRGAPDRYVWRFDDEEAEPFCACGRRRSECDGSRADCVEVAPRCLGSVEGP